MRRIVLQTFVAAFLFAGFNLSTALARAEYQGGLNDALNFWSYTLQKPSEPPLLIYYKGEKLESITGCLEALAAWLKQDGKTAPTGEMIARVLQSLKEKGLAMAVDPSRGVRRAYYHIRLTPPTIAFHVPFNTTLEAAVEEGGLCPEDEKNLLTLLPLLVTLVHEFQHHVDHLDSRFTPDPKLTKEERVKRWRQMYHEAEMAAYAAEAQLTLRLFERLKVDLNTLKRDDPVDYAVAHTFQRVGVKSRQWRRLVFVLEREAMEDYYRSAMERAMEPFAIVPNLLVGSRDDELSVAADKFEKVGSWLVDFAGEIDKDPLTLTPDRLIFLVGAEHFFKTGAVFVEGLRARCMIEKGDVEGLNSEDAIAKTVLSTCNLRKRIMTVYDKVVALLPKVYRQRRTFDQEAERIRALIDQRIY